MNIVCRKSCDVMTELLTSLHNNMREKCLSLYLIYYTALRSEVLVCILICRFTEVLK
jgi:hypothetical protein